MSNKSGTSEQVISLPSGGGALSGIGEKFSPDLFTGTGNFTVPIALPPGRNGFQPELNLVYSTGNGNGPFGLGWSLSIPGVSRKTSQGVPRYQDAVAELKERDTFILSGAEDLVPISDLKGVFTAETRDGVVTIIEHLVLQRGIEAVVLAGTELPLLLNSPMLAGVPLLDTTELHVKAIVARLKNETNQGATTTICCSNHAGSTCANCAWTGALLNRKALGAHNRKECEMKWISLGLVSVLALCSTASFAQQLQLPDDPALREQIRKLDLAHAEAIFKGDKEALEQLFPDDHTVNHPTNRIVQEKDELLKLIEEGVVRYTRFERRPEKFLFYKDWVVVMGDETVVPAPGAPNAGKVLRRRYTNVWILHDGKWLLAFRHANNVPETSGK